MEVDEVGPREGEGCSGKVVWRITRVFIANNYPVFCILQRCVAQASTTTTVSTKPGAVLCLSLLQHQSRSWKRHGQSRAARLEQTTARGTDQSRVVFRRLEDCKEQ